MIAMEPKSELALNALMFVVKQAAIGNIRVPLSFNLTEQQIHELLKLDAQELNNMALMSNMNIMNISFDTEAVEIALEINGTKSLRRKEINKMLRAGASYPIMNHIYGLTTENVGHYKKMIGLPESLGGRPSNATDSEKCKLWELMGNKNKFNDADLADKLLDAHDKTGLKICTIWTMLKEYWNEEQEQKNKTVLKKRQEGLQPFSSFFKPKN